MPERKFFGSPKYIDKPFWVIFISLGLFALLIFLSSSSSLVNAALAKGKPAYSAVIWQVVYLFAGMGLAYVIQLFPSWTYRIFGYFAFAVGLLFITLNTMGIGVEVDGAVRWLKIGPVTVQSSDVAKLGLILVVCDQLSRIHDEASTKRVFWTVLALTGITCLLIVKSNMSTVLLILIVIYLMLFIARIPFKWLAILAVLAISLAVGSYLYVENKYVKNNIEVEGFLGRANVWVKRMDTKIEDWRSDTLIVTKDNYQPTMSKIAVAMGGKSIIGVGIGNSEARHFLPYAYSDYIFAIVVEETGIVGALVLIVLYLWVLFRACYSSSRFPDYSAQLMVMGLGVMIAVQAFIAMAVAVDVGPSTGQPLPLMAKGGTSVLITCIYFGIMMGVAREQNELKAIQQQTEEESKNDVPEVIIEDNNNQTE